MIYNQALQILVFMSTRDIWNWLLPSLLMMGWYAVRRAPHIKITWSARWRKNLRWQQTMHMCMWDSTSLKCEINKNCGLCMFCISKRFPNVLVFRIHTNKHPCWPQFTFGILFYYHNKKWTFFYLEALGCLMFAQLATWLDISYVMHIVAKFTSKPSSIDFTIVRKIYKFLWGIIH